ncbi:MAG: cytochrome c-type biogenesis protein CcmH [Steroidobacteraceae bacterium]|jgi:cytochrome c-type biogenesis protein CcmH|nr:cytochrome c-type biogenesis protein CcmH [Steroidobacteraceae bacterium]
MLLPRLAAIFLLAAAPALAIDMEPAFEDPAMQARYDALTRELRCTVCQNQTIADSNASLARDLRREVRRLMAEGKSDQEVRDFLTARYTDFVLYKPPVKPQTYLLWAAPFLLLVGGLGAAGVVIARRARLARENPSLLDDDNEHRTERT